MPIYYDPNISKIVAMDQALKNYSQDLGQIKAAEVHYERMRTLNNTTILQVDLQRSAGNILGSLSIDTIWNSPGDRAITAALAEARSSILSRAVGPLEGLPVGDYIQDSVRAKNVITHTMVGPEQRLISKLSQMQGNQWTTIRNYIESTSATNDKTISNVIRNKQIREGVNVYVDGNDLKDNLFSTKHGRVDTNSLVNPAPLGVSNKWLPEKYGAPYGNEYGIENISTDIFPLLIKNLASSRTVGFPAYISNFNEADSASWTNISLINRSEDLYIYQRAERSFNLEFHIVATTDKVIFDAKTKEYNSKGYPIRSILGPDGQTLVDVVNKKEMWSKINFLHQCTRPTYSDGKYDKAPYCRLWLGDLFTGIHMVIDSVNIGYDPMIWDININDFGGIRPMVAVITLSGKFIHNKAPHAHYEFY